MQQNLPIIRSQHLATRQNLTLHSISKASQLIQQQLFDLILFQKSQNIAVYVSVRGEVHTREIIEKIWATNKNCYLPVTAADPAKPMLFVQYRKDAILQKNKFDIPEPVPNIDNQILPQNLDLVVVPLVAFDSKGNRLGSGCGNYDRTFAFKKTASLVSAPYLIGIAYEWQKIDALTPQKWDVPLDIIITADKLYHCA